MSNNNVNVIRTAVWFRTGEVDRGAESSEKSVLSPETASTVYQQRNVSKSLSLSFFPSFFFLFLFYVQKENEIK